MTIVGLIWCNRRMYLLMTALYVVVAALFYTAAGTLGVSFACVALAVSFLRDIGYFRRSVAIWPVLQKVLDSHKIEELTCDDAPSPTQSMEPTAQQPRESP